MHLYRAAWQRLATASRGTAALLRNAPTRQMSSASVPGSSGVALPYYLFVGVTFTGGGIYVYRTLNRDRARFQDRHNLLSRSKEEPELSAKGLEAEPNDVSEAIEEAAESVTVEAVAVTVEDVTEEESIQTASLEEEQPLIEEQETASPAVEEITASSEVTPTPVEERIEVTEEVLGGSSSPVLEAVSDNVLEDLASAVEELASPTDDWSELSARKPEEIVEETLQVTEECNEIEESEKVAASS
ncbi:MGARP isoform X2 [Pelobates cultripes]|uniref:MGARP isoform X2 n=1 Tax=Pelobates cultripes TaxID=61616 RepID=A0AAD1WB85_PELCU|nr:MGARP isoform X2 [Pelobates cultripes]